MASPRAVILRVHDTAPVDRPTVQARAWRILTRARAGTASLPPGFAWLVGAQFASALADNALLIVTIALLQRLAMPPWWSPMLKFGFTLSYVLFAPFVGALADSFPKSQLMVWTNAIKFTGVAALLLGAHPVLVFVIVGFGAAVHAPAKYGLITELVPPEQLVAANGWMEVTIVCAVLGGTMVGGALVSPGLLALWGHWPALAGRHGGAASMGVLVMPLLAVLAVYTAAAALSRAVPDSGARYPACAPHPLTLARHFWQDHLTLWRDRDGGLSLAVTTIFWGVGATLQFVVLRWAADVLKLPLSQCAYLQAAVAVGVVGGAAGAARWIALANAKNVLIAGVVLGLMMPLVACTKQLEWAVVWLILAGAVGGILVVPLNALLQHRGYALFSAGRSVAIQGFNENASVLGMLAIYATLIALNVPIVPLMWGFGLCIAATIGLLMRRESRRQRTRDASSGRTVTP